MTILNGPIVLGVPVDGAFVLCSACLLFCMLFRLTEETFLWDRDCSREKRLRPEERRESNIFNCFYPFRWRECPMADDHDEHLVWTTQGILEKQCFPVFRNLHSKGERLDSENIPMGSVVDRFSVFRSVDGNLRVLGAATRRSGQRESDFRGILLGVPWNEWGWKRSCGSGCA